MSRFPLPGRTLPILLFVALAAFGAGLMVSSQLGQTPSGAALTATSLTPADISSSDGDLVLTQGLFRSIVQKSQKGVVNIYTTRYVSRQNWYNEMFRDLPEWFRRHFQNPQDEEGDENDEERVTPDRSLGSGMILEIKPKSALILTNKHVIEGADDIKVLLFSNHSYTAEIVGQDDYADVALLSIQLDGTEDITALPLGDSNRVQVGDWVIAIGNPFGFSNTVTAGVISATGGIRSHVPGAYIDYLQTDAPINPGNSGGPLLNLHGEVIGLNNWIYTRTYQWSGLGFAVPINYVKQILPQLKEKGYVERGYLGVYVPRAESEEILRNLGAEHGAAVIDVEKGSPAEEAGLKRYDVILEVNGRKVKSAEELPDIISTYSPGSKVKLKILRDGKTIEKQVTLAIRETKKAAAPKESPERLGMEFTEVTPEIARSLRLPGEYGLVIRRIGPGSPAFDAQLEPQDVILEADRTRLNTIEDFARIVDTARAKGRKSIILYVWRRGSGFLTTLNLPDSDKK